MNEKRGGGGQGFQVKMAALKSALTVLQLLGQHIIAVNCLRVSDEGPEGQTSGQFSPDYDSYSDVIVCTTEICCYSDK